MKNESLDRRKPKIVMFCGKGGVGKTTCASATAIHYASRGKRTLLISTDPSPSLTDILEINVMGDITKVPGVENLKAVELDYDKVLEMWKIKFGDEIFEVISLFLPARAVTKLPLQGFEVKGLEELRRREEQMYP